MTSVQGMNRYLKYEAHTYEIHTYVHLESEKLRERNFRVFSDVQIKF